MLEIPPSTLRRYAAMFAHKLSDQKGRIHRLYSETDVLTFQQVKRLTNQNIPLEKIADRLEVIEEATKEDQRETLALIPGIASEIEAARSTAAAALAQLASLEATILASNEKAEQLAAQLAKAEERQAATAKELEDYLSLSWWKKIFYKSHHS